METIETFYPRSEMKIENTAKSRVLIAKIKKNYGRKLISRKGGWRGGSERN